ncbi:MAG: glucose-1-phosphate cytidylyltransferase [Gammaproteobacteria bacterium RIFCSPHIGHO2_12_FULL_35_23]|nr:MAG: glucose-1-phosphate cytidylyltransferase [Gammaproteobacteria bacterium RIFCSPHIGHO2_12_FULL_35_23]
MKVVILCGGQGTRIRSVSEHLPKPMIEIGGRPILWHIMKYYAYWEFKNFILCLGYKSEIIKNFFLNYRYYIHDFTLSLSSSAVKYHTHDRNDDWQITLAETGLDSMTGARVKKIKSYLGKDKYFLLTYGDGVGNINLKELVKFHQRHGKIMTVTGVRPPGRFGELVSNKTNTVIEFNEKPQVASGLISGGFFVCDQRIFDYLNDQEDLVFEEGPMKSLVRDKQLMVYQHEDFWQPMDTYRDFQFLNKLVETKKAPWMIW